MLETALLFLTSSKDEKNARKCLQLEILMSPKLESLELFYGLKSLNDSKTTLNWSNSFFNELESESKNYARTCPSM